MKFKNGFTLSEVLITLGVIGVVSAMTIPTVINKYQEKVTVTKVKKFYSMISQAFMLSVKDNGYANEWNVNNGKSATTARQIASYMKPYLKIIKDCDTNSGCLNYTDNPKTLKGNNCINYDTNSNYYKIILSDGSYLTFRGAGSYCHQIESGYTDLCGTIVYDLNGGKQPNTFGKDMFEFVITPFAVKPSNSNDCGKGGNGYGCSGYIFKNGNMDYLH